MVITDESKIIKIGQDYYNTAKYYHSTFCERVQEDFGFYDGDKQWHEQVYDKKTKKYSVENTAQKMRQRGKLPLTLNFVFPLVNLLCGLQSQQPFAVSVLPRSGDDEIIARHETTILKFIWDRCLVDSKLSRAFKDGVICGRGWLSVEQVDDEEALYSTRTIISSVSPHEIIVDPRSRENDLSDADFLIRRRRVNKQMASLVWPEKADEVKAYTYDDSDFDSERDTDTTTSGDISSVLITEIWYREWLWRYYLAAQDGSVVEKESGSEEEEKVLEAAYQQGLAKRKIIKKIKFARFAGDSCTVLLDSGNSPYDDGFFPYVAYYAYRGVNYDYGIVAQIKDTQREINKRRSIIIDLLKRVPKSKLVTESPEVQRQFADEDSDSILMPKGGDFKIIPPPQFPAAFAQLEEFGKDDIKRISGISDDLRGFRTSNESGVAIDIRRQQSMANVSALFDNLEATTKLASTLLISRVRQYMDAAEIIRLIGDSRSQGEEGLDKIIALIKNKKTTVYDLAVSQSPSSPTSRAENFIKLQALMQIFPNLVPPEMYIEASDIPQKDELIAQVKAKQAQVQQAQQTQMQSNLNSAMPLPENNGNPMSLSA